VQPKAPAAPRKKIPPDIYTIFLAIALVAVLVAILFLYLEMNAYEFKSKGAMPIASVQWPVASGQWLVALIPNPSSLSEHGCSHSKIC
jgi:hypothetical protein